MGSWDSVAGVTQSGLDDPGSNSGGGDFTYPSRPATRPADPSVQWEPGLFHGVMRVRV
jgi:hypothetical protein